MYARGISKSNGLPGAMAKFVDVCLGARERAYTCRESGRSSVRRSRGEERHDIPETDERRGGV